MHGREARRELDLHGGPSGKSSVTVVPCLPRFEVNLTAVRFDVYDARIGKPSPVPLAGW